MCETHACSLKIRTAHLLLPVAGLSISIAIIVLDLFLIFISGNLKNEKQEIFLDSHLVLALVLTFIYQFEFGLTQSKQGLIIVQHLSFLTLLVSALIRINASGKNNFIRHLGRSILLITASSVLFLLLNFIIALGIPYDLKQSFGQALNAVPKFIAFIIVNWVILFFITFLASLISYFILRKKDKPLDIEDHLISK